MLNGVLEEIGDGIDTAKGLSSVSGILGGGAAGWFIPIKSLAEIVRMLERRGVVYLYCGTVGVVGAETKDVGILGAWILLVLPSPRRDCSRILGALGAIG